MLDKKEVKTIVICSQELLNGVLTRHLGMPKWFDLWEEDFMTHVEIMHMLKLPIITSIIESFFSNSAKLLLLLSV